MNGRRRRPLEPDQPAPRQPLGGRTSRLDTAGGARAASGGGGLRKPPGAGRGRENAPNLPTRSPRFHHQRLWSHQQQEQEQQAPQPLARHYDAMLLHSLSAAVAAAGHSGSCWLDAASDSEEVSSMVQLPSPTAARGCGPAPALLRTPVGGAAAANGQPGSPGLLLPHLQSAGAEDCSWLMSSSPVASPGHASSPSLAFSASLSRSISLGAGSEHTGVSSSAQPAALQAVKVRSPAGGAAPQPGSLEGTPPSGTPPAGSPPAAADAADAAEPGSPVTLQPPPESQHAAAAEAAASGGWWSPGQGPARLAAHSSGDACSAGSEEASRSLSPLAAALQSGSPPGDVSCEGETPPAGGRRRAARRRHSSPFLARDCSEVDVFCPDRYSLWTRQQQDAADRQPDSTPQRPASAGAAVGRPASSAAQQPPRWQAYATTLEDAELGMGQEAQAAGSPAGVAASGGRRLRHAFSSMLRWVSGKLQSHPIELTPSELAYSSCHSSPEVSPQQWEPQDSGRGSSPGTSRFATPGSGGGGDRRRPGSGSAAAAAAAAAAGMPRRHLCYSGADELAGGSSCGSEGSCSASPGSAGAPGCQDSGHLMAAGAAVPHAAGCEAAGSPAGSSSSTVVLAQEDSLGPAEGSQLRAEGSVAATEDSLSNYQTPRSCSPCSASPAAARGTGCAWRGGRASSVGSC